MHSARTEEKDQKSSEDKRLPEKAIESLMTILFVFASWITGYCNLPGLNGKIITDFCTKQCIPTQVRNICCTVIDVEVSDDQKKSAQIAGVTLIPARRKPTVDLQRNPPKLDWLLGHETYYPKLGDLENVQYVVGHDSMTADAARDIRDSLFPDAELHLLKVDLPGVLVVFDKWDIEKYGLPEFHRNLWKDVSSRTGKGVKVYATVLDVDVTEAQREDAEKAGISLIPARRAKHLDSDDDPINIRWLSYPESHYPELKELPNVQYVIGYAPMTAKAAANIHKSLFSKAKLYQINAIHPDYHSNMTSKQQSKLERDMLNIAEESDAMVSIGPSMYGHFENIYRAITDRTITHIELLPKAAECFKKQAINLKESTPQHVILSYGEVDSDADIISDYSKIAPQIGKVASAQKEVHGHTIKWNILDIPSEFTELEKRINKLTECDYEIAKLKPTGDLRQILTHLKQSHLCIIGSHHTDYGFYGLETIAAGLPTYADRDSQLGTFITKYLKSYKDIFLVSSAQEWYGKTKAAVTDTVTALKWADGLKKAYLECKEVDQSYGRFTALFTEEKEPSEDLPLTIDLNTQPWKQHLQELHDQIEMMSRQEPCDQSAVAAITQDFRDVSDTLKQCQQRFKRKTDHMVDKENETLKRVCSESDCGVNQAKITKGCLGMFLNFLSILSLYRFKSSVQTGRFAKLYEPWLITDGMREIAAKVNLPLKLQVTYDQKKFDELDAFFISRERRQCESCKHSGGEIVVKFKKEPKRSPMVEIPAPRLLQNTSTTEVEDNFSLGADRVILFQLDQKVQSRQVTTDCLLRIMSIDSSTVLKHLCCDVIGVRVKITEKIRHILSSKQEILALLGIQAFLLTDVQQVVLREEAFGPQFRRQGNTITPITATHHSLVVRGLLLFDISHSKAGRFCDLCFIDLEQTGRQGDRQAQVQVLKGQLHNAMSEKSQLEKQYREKLKELDQANKAVKQLGEHLDKEVEDKKKAEKQLEQVKKDTKLLQNEFDSKVKVFKSQLHDATQEKSVVIQQYQERINELEITYKITAGKVREIKLLTQEIDELETKLQESSDLISKREEQLLDAQNRASESETLKDELDRAREEKEQIQKELDIAKEQKRVALEKDDDPAVEGGKTEKTDAKTKEKKSEGMLSKLRRRITGGKKKSPETSPSDQAASTTAKLSGSTAGSETGMSTSGAEPKPIGGTEYIGRNNPLSGKHGGQKWTLQVLGSLDSGTEPGQFNAPRGLAWHGDQLVICDTENHRIQILNKNKVVIEIIRFDGQFDKEFMPWDVAISPDGHFFIADIGNNQIIICDQNKKIIQIIPQSADIEVRSITVMAAFIFVTDRKGKSLIKYNIKDGKLVARVSDQFSNPHSVMATSNNHLLVSDEDKRVIHVLDSDLNFLNSYHNDRLKSPRGLDVDSHGNIYICTGQSKGIVKLRSDGQLDCVLFEGELYHPGFIAVNDDITTTIALTESWPYRTLFSSPSVDQISVYSVST